MALGFLLVGCGGGGGNSQSASPFTGSWSGTWSNNGNNHSGTAAFTVAAADGTVTGTIHDATANQDALLTGSITENGATSLTAVYTNSQGPTETGAATLSSNQLSLNLTATTGPTTEQFIYNLTRQS